MRLVLACVGRLKAGAERDLVTRYVDRIRPAGRPLGLGPCDMIEIPESAARRAEDRMAEEGAALLAALPAGAGLIALDPRGRQVSSEDFAARVAAQRDGGLPALAFVIGGADGLADAVRDKAALMVAYGTATFPHQLVRVMLAEQIYRAVTILSGHPYHRA
ncbi:23S rRNA (pseudouridine(1915)-N(3))-methyltransferase RlmH [Xanthobacter versatilis]|uniref:23S rRNA (pseudouridine(1915)-N(3))-methyltransferase RlmH n=1 Tax=Xanthobacter autotrophicus (strain ATCC BAA-1158 / Py2) TaxID=78245 RepID=UPI00372752D6